MAFKILPNSLYLCSKLLTPYLIIEIFLFVIICPYFEQVNIKLKKFYICIDKYPCK